MAWRLAPSLGGTDDPPIRIRRDRLDGGRMSKCGDKMLRSYLYEANQCPCRDAGVNAIAPGFAMLVKSQNALHTLIHQRHLTPSRGGFALPRREQWIPGKDIHGEL
jgi:hypothetical protein